MGLPVTTPAETLQISPEALEIANAYLTSDSKNIDEIAEQLDIPKHIVTSLLDKREVKAYINHVFANTGFNNRFRMREAMDAILTKKFQELEEADVGSGKDIADLMKLSHEMTMDQLRMELELEKVRTGNIKNQLNVQINDGVGSKYDSLIQQLLQAGSPKNVVSG